MGLVPDHSVRGRDAHHFRRTKHLPWQHLQALPCTTAVTKRVGIQSCFLLILLLISTVNMTDTLLSLESSIAFSGAVKSGIKVHKDNQHLIYPIGCTVVIENIANGRQEFLSGHTKNVSCLAVSKSGNYIASGQITDTGFKADVMVWNFHERRMSAKLVLHRNNVEALAFSPNDKYLVSLGGQDDGSIVVWNIETKQAICGAPAQMMSAGLTNTVAFSSKSDDVFISGGDGTLRVWMLDVEHRKIWPKEVQMGQLKRVISCIEMAEDDSFFYCGTTTGDLIAINMNSRNFQCIGPEKGRFSQGVTSISLLPKNEILVGAGDGSVTVVKGKEENFKRTKKIQKVQGMVTSIGLRDKGHQFFVGTSMSNMYKFDFTSFTHELKTTCHYDKVNDLSLAFGSSDLLGTCSTQEVRVWFTPINKEVLRISVPNMICNAVAIMRDGKSIVTGWSDASIRAYSPETGKPIWDIKNSSGSSVTALATFSDCRHVVSGSNHGHVIVWTVPSQSQFSSNNGKQLYVNEHVSMKEHKAEITCIKVTRDDKECVTSCTDGSCIIWNLEKGCRKQMIRVNTLFKYVIYHPDQHQIMTTGTDRKISYWDVTTGSMIRELEGSSTGSVNAMDISEDGMTFVSGGDDKLIKVWNYEEGVATHVGIGHSAAVTGVKITPNKKHILSISADGAILKWAFPW